MWPWKPEKWVLNGERSEEHQQITQRAKTTQVRRWTCRRHRYDYFPEQLRVCDLKQGLALCLDVLTTVMEPILGFEARPQGLTKPRQEAAGEGQMLPGSLYKGSRKKFSDALSSLKSCRGRCILPQH